MRKEGEDNATTLSRKAKTVMFMRARAQFMRELHAGIGRAARKAKREGLRLCVRLNGATDLNWVAVSRPIPIPSSSTTPSLWRARSRMRRASCPPITTYFLLLRRERQRLRARARGGR